MQGAKTRTNRYARAAVAAAAAAALLAGTGALPPAADAGAPARPNFLVIQTDDQTLDTLTPRFMPRTHRLLVERGVDFADAVVTTPTCCPSRVSLLTGQYAHNHGVRSNSPGYPELRRPGNVLPAWLQAEGYRTGHVGKWLNGYQRVRGTKPAPGWDEWRTLLDYDYYGYKLSIDGREVRFGDEEDEYLTRVLTRKAAALVRRYSRRRAPFYLQLDHFAPHQSNRGSRRCPSAAVPDPRDQDLFRHEPLPAKPSVNEADVSDKRRYIRNRPKLTGDELERTLIHHRCRLASLRGVDRSIAKLWRTLHRTGELDDTIVVFASDNGFLSGEHRIGRGKIVPYRETTDVPLAIRIPKRLAGPAEPAAVAELVANIDLAPTILDYAGAEPCAGGACRRLDGRSLRPLLAAAGPWPSDRALALEYGSGRSNERQAGLCHYEGVRERAAVYVRYNVKGDCGPADERELYDLASDPFELENVAGDPDRAVQQAALHSRLAELRTCSGIAGRDPAQPGTAFCE